ncbi:MAG: PIN domain-containing protein [Fibromonadales bacterium]|nr:PIN domain-containing protein [Fibromonadales bacterium]
MSRYALDTNIISYLLRGDKGLQERISYEVKNGDGVVILPIVYYEIKRGLIDKNAMVKLAAFERLCNILGIDGMDTKTLDIAANIYAYKKQQGQQIEDADILIAASCVAHGYILVTNNERHFLGIKGLEVANWLG